VYDRVDAGVRKTYEWGEAVGTLVCLAAGRTLEDRPRSPSPTDAARARLAAAFDAGESLSVRRERAAAADTAETRARLQALGYF
jgi:hypothetical protein